VKGERKMPQYQPELWKDDTYGWSEQVCSDRVSSYPHPDAREQSRLLDLLGRINYKILTGNRVYVEVGGVVYRTLYGGYWRSVFTGIQHYLLRCEEIHGSIWNDETNAPVIVDLPISYSDEGWSTSGHSLSFILSRE
jgi:hypothetical protein